MSKDLKMDVHILETYEKTVTLDIPQDIVNTDVDYDHGEKTINTYVDDSDLKAVWHENHLEIEELLEEFKGLCKRILEDQDNFRENPGLLEYWIDECNGWEQTDYQLMKD